MKNFTVKRILVKIREFFTKDTCEELGTAAGEAIRK